MAAVYFTIHVPLMGEMSKSRKSQIVKLIFICDFPTDKSPFLSFTLFDFFFFLNKNFYVPQDSHTITLFYCFLLCVQV